MLYAPILCGVGDVEMTDGFHYNTWKHAADDFQKNEDGSFDLTVTDPVVIELYCSSCWHYDDDSSPNGGRRDLCVDPSEKLIDLAGIQAPTLVICGDVDPYLNYDLVYAVLDDLPEDKDGFRQLRKRIGRVERIAEIKRMLPNSRRKRSAGKAILTSVLKAAVKPVSMKWCMQTVDRISQSCHGPASFCRGGRLFLCPADSMERENAAEAPLCKKSVKKY